MKIICIGRNYSDHISELNNDKPDHPVIFLKPDSSILRNNTPFFIPEFTNNVHYEVEIVLKINRIGKHIDAKFANKYYEEIGLGIDFTARDVQSQLKEKGLPWEKAKAFDGSALVGKFINKNKIDDLLNLNFSLQKNKEIVQQGNTNLMLWKFDEIISYVSRYFTLKIGDLIFTGTPKGVGKVSINDKLEGYINNELMLTTKVK